TNATTRTATRSASSPARFIGYLLRRVLTNSRRGGWGAGSEPACEWGRRRRAPHRAAYAREKLGRRGPPEACPATRGGHGYRCGCASEREGEHEADHKRERDREPAAVAVGRRQAAGVPGGKPALQPLLHAVHGHEQRARQQPDAPGG